MKKIARELKAVSDGLKELISFQFIDVAPKKADFVNAICADIDDLVDRIRRNESLKMVVQRSSEGDSTAVAVSMTDHDAMDAIKKKITEKLNKVSRKKKLKIEVD